MISISEARDLVFQELKKEPEFDLVIQDSETIEKEWGWVFFYQSRKFIESGDFRDMVVGNAPYIVNKESGDLHITGTASDIFHYINEYEKSLIHNKKGQS